MEWKLVSEDGTFIQEVNCQYDSCDISHWDYEASQILIDFTKKTTTIIKRNDENIE